MGLLSDAWSTVKNSTVPSVSGALTGDPFGFVINKESTRIYQQGRNELARVISKSTGKDVQEHFAEETFLSQAASGFASDWQDDLTGYEGPDRFHEIIQSGLPTEAPLTANAFPLPTIFPLTAASGRLSASLAKQRERAQTKFTGGLEGGGTKPLSLFTM